MRSGSHSHKDQSQHGKDQSLNSSYEKLHDIKRNRSDKRCQSSQNNQQNFASENITEKTESKRDNTDKFTGHFDYTDEELYEAMINGINNYFLDDYSQYYTPDEYTDYLNQSQGRKSGIGVSLVTNSFPVQIFRVSGNSPAYKAGLKQGMYIIAAGNSIESLNTIKTYTEVINFIETKETGENFVLQASSLANGSDAENYNLTKEEFIESYVYYATNADFYDFSSGYGEENLSFTRSGNGISSLDSDTAYINLT
jgi:C-terminal processing protease CtpA/Prc